MTVQQTHYTPELRYLLQVRSPGVPQLVIAAPEELAAARKRIESFDPTRLRGVVRLVGLGNPGEPIQVVLAPENSPWAQGVSGSTAGFAISHESLVVLFPARSPAYPHDTLEDVLHHEVTHVLIARAAREAPLPLWFHEGLAVIGERTWGLEDRARLLRELVFVRRTSLQDVDALFATGASPARAYTLSAAFVRDLIRNHGAGAPASVLTRVASGEPFQRAFEQTTGESLEAAEIAFWDRHRFWTAFGPFLTTPTALWTIVTLVALYAIFRRRQQRAAQRRKWEQQGLD